MIDERQEELAALAALDLLEGADQAEFDGACARNPELRRRVDELREAAALLAHSAPAAAPPAQLKDRILASAAARDQAKPPAARSPARFFFVSFVPWALAAGFALAAAFLAQLYFTARTENRILRDQQRLADLTLQSAHNEMEAQRIVSTREIQQLRSESDMAKMQIAMLTSMMHRAPQAEAVAVWNPMKQEGVLCVAKMPMPEANRDYQLWYIPVGSKAAPISAGVFHVDPSSGGGTMLLHASKPMPEVAKFAVSDEPKGGMPSPTGQIVLVSN